MLKKILFVLVCMALMLGASSSAALAGNGVPPVVETPNNGSACYMPWIVWRHDRTSIAPITVTGVMTFVYQPSTGFWTMTCRFTIDFDNPMTLTIDEACGILEEFYPDQMDCKENLFVWRGLDCWLDDMVTTDTVATVNPSGVGVATCKFFP